MKATYLNKENNDNLIIFFAGWSFDEKPFISQNYGKNDIIIVYDYNEMELPKELENIDRYPKKYLLAWSMGVFVAYLNRNFFGDFEKKTALNGTTYPVDDVFGIPEKVFKLTLMHAKKGLEGKFYKNLFDNEASYNLYTTSPVGRTIENRVKELESLDNQIKNTKINYSKFYDNAIISSYDKIIPPQNQINFCKEFKIPYKLLDCGHFPFYNNNIWQGLQ